MKLIGALLRSLGDTTASEVWIRGRLRDLGLQEGYLVVWAQSAVDENHLLRERAARTTQHLPAVAALELLSPYDKTHSLQPLEQLLVESLLLLRPGWTGALLSLRLADYLAWDLQGISSRDFNDLYGRFRSGDSAILQPVV